MPHGLIGGPFQSWLDPWYVTLGSRMPDTKLTHQLELASSGCGWVDLLKREVPSWVWVAPSNILVTWRNIKGPKEGRLTDCCFAASCLLGHGLFLLCSVPMSCHSVLEPASYGLKVLHTVNWNKFNLSLLGILSQEWKVTKTLTVLLGGVAWSEGGGHWECDLDGCMLICSLHLPDCPCPSLSLSPSWISWIEQLFSIMPFHRALPAKEPDGHGLKPCTKINLSSFKLLVLGILSSDWEVGMICSFSHSHLQATAFCWNRVSLLGHFLWVQLYNIISCVWLL